MKTLLLVPAISLVACSTTIDPGIQQNFIILAQAHNRLVKCFVDNSTDYKKVAPCLKAQEDPEPPK